MADQKLMNFFSLDPQHILSDIDKVLHQLDMNRCTGRIIALNSLENRVYLAELEDGTEVVVKFYRPYRWNAEQISEEHSFLAKLTEHEIPVVAPLRVGSQSAASGLGISLFKTSKQSGEILMTVFPKVRGRLTDELSSAQAEILGRYIGRMHMVSSSFPLQHRPALNLSTFGDDSLDDLEKSGLAKSPPAMRYLKVAEEFLDLVDPILLDASGEASENLLTVHGDCHVGNILWNGDAPFLLDFDDLTTCIRAQDLWLIAPGRDVESLKIRDSVLKGYEQFSHFDDSELACIEALRGLRMIHYTAWVARRWADPIFPKTFVQFASDRYWQEETQALQEGMEILTSGALGDY